MENFTRRLSIRWVGRARALLALAIWRLLHDDPHGDAAWTVAWLEMKPIDFEGEDTSLTEAELRQLR